MSDNLYLKEEMKSPDGSAPDSGWLPVEGELKRSAGLWIEGDPRSLVSEPDLWLSRLDLPDGAFGLRVRFVLDVVPPQEYPLMPMLCDLLSALSGCDKGLYIHAEVMEGPEAGLYFAYDNRPPALMTQFHLTGDTIDGTLESVPIGPLHLNLLFHDQSLGFGGACKSGVISSVTRRIHEIAKSVGQHFDVGAIHELSIARSDIHKEGVSVGIEAVGRERGSRGGAPVDPYADIDRLVAEMASPFPPMR